ncbi:EAL domain-containing protein [Microbacterium sp. NPDC058345]|uniref:EAL domain-containing protein n=1 Tax=Microbacterium sp. NPDC058345 TaxID=3346455 RepID=UPI0036593F00
MTHPIGARAHFQPIVDLRLMRLAGFEALARFDDGVSPLEHLQAAERAGARAQLELRLIEGAVTDASALPREAFVTLNASGRTMIDPFLAELLQRGERSWGLELFEGSPPEECVAVREQVDRLGGFLLIDDAGADFADEKRIRDLRPDIVKIDRGLFWESLADAAGRERLDGILAAADAAGARTLVEGVEDAGQLDAARALGVDFAQGYHLGRPTPVEDVPQMLADLQRRVGVDAAGL